MKKWIVQVEFTSSVEIEVEAETARQAEELALGQIEDPEEFEVAHVEAFRDWEAEEDEEEEFEPGRPILDQMALNP